MVDVVPVGDLAVPLSAIMLSAVFVVLSPASLPVIAPVSVFVRLIPQRELRISEEVSPALISSWQAVVKLEIQSDALEKEEQAATASSSAVSPVLVVVSRVDIKVLITSCAV